jgi:hypothetical protein
MFLLGDFRRLLTERRAHLFWQMRYGAFPFRSRSRFLNVLARRGALFRVGLPFSGGGNFTPARRALESPMAIACLAEPAPCFPSRMWSISSRTNSPALVEGALPSAASLRALWIGSFSGITF